MAPLLLNHQLVKRPLLWQTPSSGRLPYCYRASPSSGMKITHGCQLCDGSFKQRHSRTTMFMENRWWWGRLSAMPNMGSRGQVIKILFVSICTGVPNSLSIPFFLRRWTKMTKRSTGQGELLLLLISLRKLGQNWGKTGTFEISRHYYLTSRLWQHNDVIHAWAVDVIFWRFRGRWVQIHRPSPFPRWVSFLEE